MTVLHVSKLSQRGGADQSGASYLEKYLVITSTNDDGIETVGGAVGIPQYGTPYYENFALRCTSKSVDPVAEDGEGWQWHVTCEYTYSFINENPLFDPPDIVWGGEQFQKVMLRDRNGKAILNAAGDLFDPPYLRDDSREVVVVTRNIIPITPTYIGTYRDVINSDWFTVDGRTFGPEKGKIKWIDLSGLQIRNNIHFRTVSIPIQINDEGWREWLLNAGSRKIVAGGLERCRNADGTPVHNPVPLAANGSQILNPSPLNAVFLPFDVFGLLPFSVLPLT